MNVRNHSRGQETALLVAELGAMLIVLHLAIFRSPSALDALAGVLAVALLGLVRLAGRRARLRHRALARELSAGQAQQEQLRHQAYHDALTGLPNRRVLTERCAQALRDARSGDRRPVVMILDLDGFKAINDAVGHAAGDEVIAEVAERIATALPEGGTAARMGGDEFAVLLHAVSRTEEAAHTARALVRSIEQSYRMAGRVLALSACVGIAMARDDATTVRDLLSDADLAMYHAKARGRGSCEVFTAEMRRAHTERLRMQEHLTQALRRNQLSVVYQPQVELCGGRVTGVEALARWTHPEHGEVPPDVFVPMAEQLGLIAEIDRWVLRTACEDLQRWQELGWSLRVAVNMSGHDLESDTLVDDVRATLQEFDVDAWRLELELTEGTAVRQQEHAVRRLHELRALGVRVAIDDFGTGYSMLSRLRTLPIDRLKIDRSFVLDIARDEDAAAIVRSTITMGHALGLTLIAEGVESAAALDRLAQLDCDVAQGFHICPPLPAAEFETWLASTGAVDGQLDVGVLPVVEVDLTLHLDPAGHHAQ